MVELKTYDVIMFAGSSSSSDSLMLPSVACDTATEGFELKCVEPRSVIDR